MVWAGPSLLYRLARKPSTVVDDVKLFGNLFHSRIDCSWEERVVVGLTLGVFLIKTYAAFSTAVTLF